MTVATNAFHFTMNIVSYYTTIETRPENEAAFNNSSDPHHPDSVGPQITNNYYNNHKLFSVSVQFLSLWLGMPWGENILCPMLINSSGNSIQFLFI